MRPPGRVLWTLAAPQARGCMMRMRRRRENAEIARLPGLNCPLLRHLSRRLSATFRARRDRLGSRAALLPQDLEQDPKTDGREPEGKRFGGTGEPAQRGRA